MHLQTKAYMENPQGLFVHPLTTNI